MGPYLYKYPRPAATVDLAVFALTGEEIRVLMVRRKNEPFAGRWALPGGYVEIEEPLEAAARRELKEETGLEIEGPVEFFGVFGRPGRDPRGRTISIAHAAVVRPPLPRVRGSDDAAGARWIARDEATGLAFDHDEMLESAFRWLRDRTRDGPAGLGILKSVFRAADVARLHRAVFGDDSGAAAWAGRMQARHLIGPVEGRRGSFESGPPGRHPARYATPFRDPSAP